MPPLPTELAVKPYTSSQEHLLAELARIDLRVRMQATRARHLAGDDRFRGLVISDADAFALFERPLGSPHWASAPELVEIEAQRQRLDAEVAARRQQSLAQGVALRLEALAQKFELDRCDVDLLLIGIAPELDPRYERLFAYLHDDVTRKRPTVELALGLLCPSIEARLSARERFAATSPLLRHGILRLFTDAPQLQPPLLQQAFRVDERIVDFLHGSDDLDERLGPYAQRSEPVLSLPEVVLPAELKARVAALVSGTPRLLLHLHGAAGTGRGSLAGALCRSLGRSLLRFNAAATLALAGERFDALVALALREARLLDAALFIESFDSLLSEESKHARALLLKRLDASPALVFLSGELPFEPCGEPLTRPFVRVMLPMPGAAERTLLWQSAMGADAALAPAPAPDEGVQPEALARDHQLTGGQIRDAVATARGLARLRSPLAPRLTAADLTDACHRQSQPRLGALAQLIKSASGWEDLVLSSDRLQRLREIGIHARHRSQVLNAWGFERKLPTGRGLSVLFSGPPGTGKTLAASVIANDLRLDLFQIDLSAVVSKYIGETEKQLARVFAAAEGSRAVLFFDEADALFGKRSETRDAHDRYANMEVAYLLQRMDSYEGVVILATNLGRNMDEAFMRRMRFIIDFPLPDEQDRRRIWTSILPAGVPREPSLDLELMARRFELSGGYIRNIALAATFLAAEERSALGQRHLLRAARREYQKLGKIMDEAMFVDQR